MPTVPTEQGFKLAGRLRSLDVFRGLTVAAMVIVNNPGDWGAVYAPLLHAEWDGWTPTDLIFPFFLFIVGVSLTFGGQNRQSAGRVLRRGAVLWGLGLFMAAFPFFRLSTLRIPGVLARIAWSYVATWAIVRAIDDDSPAVRRRRAAVVVAILLIGYWIALTWVPVPGGSAGNRSPAGNLGAWLDRALMRGHLYRTDWDPEGLLSTAPAIGTTLLGVIAGWWMQETESPRRRVRGLLSAGLVSVLLGLLWDSVFPINKSLWTSSYVLFTGGLAAVCLAVCYWFLDLRVSEATARAFEPFVVLGRNAILLFVVSGLFAKTVMYLKWPDPSLSLGRWIYTAAFLPLASPRTASLLFALANLAILYSLLAYLHRRRVYLSV
ncbi:MAG: acyltransferase family protein [Vicinamibacterales bacterium]